MTPIGPEEDTPAAGVKRQVPDEWIAQSTGEWRRTVAQEQRKSSWWKVLGVSGGAVALVQLLNSAGPCNAGWKFQTIEAAAQSEAALKAENAADHTSIRKEIADSLGKVLTAIQNQPKKGK